MGKLWKDILPEIPGCSIELKASYCFQNTKMYNKTIDKVFRGKKNSNHTFQWLSHTKCTYRFFDNIIFKYIFSIKMMETIPDQLESCRYDVCKSKTIKIWKD